MSASLAGGIRALDHCARCARTVDAGQHVLERDVTLDGVPCGEHVTAIWVFCNAITPLQVGIVVRVSRMENFHVVGFQWIRARDADPTAASNQPQISCPLLELITCPARNAPESPHKKAMSWPISQAVPILPIGIFAIPFRSLPSCLSTSAIGVSISHHIQTNAIRGVRRATDLERPMTPAFAAEYAGELAQPIPHIEETLTMIPSFTGSICFSASRMQ